MNNQNKSIDDLEPFVTLIFLFGIMCWMLVLTALIREVTPEIDDNSDEGNLYWIDY